MEKLKNDSLLFENDCETEVAHVSIFLVIRSHIQTDSFRVRTRLDQESKHGAD